TATSAHSLDLKLRRRSMLSSIGCSRSALERFVQMAPFTGSRKFSNNHLNETTPANADVSIPGDDQCPALLGDNFPQHELGLRKRPEYRSTYQRKEIER